MTQEQILENISRLEKALTTGASQVKIAQGDNERTVTYRSVGAIREAISYWRAQLPKTAKPPSVRRGIVTSGWGI